MAKKPDLGKHPYTKLAQLEHEVLRAAMKLEASEVNEELLAMERVIRAAKRVRKWRERLQKAGV